MKINYMFLILSVFLLSVFLTGCDSNANYTDAGLSVQSSSERNIVIDKLEIIHFHGTSQCYSCVTMGDLAEETVNTYFKDELEKGIITFAHLNGELPENRDLVVKYGATGSSLWLGTYKGGEFTAEQNTNVWYKIQDKTAYMNYLKGVIEQKLAGN